MSANRNIDSSDDLGGMYVRLDEAIAVQLTMRHPDVAVVDVTPDLLVARAFVVGGHDTGTVWAGQSPLRPDPLLASVVAASTAEQISASPSEKSICAIEATGGVVVVAVTGAGGTVWREFSRMALPGEQLAAHLLAWALAALAGSPLAEQH